MRTKTPFQALSECERKAGSQAALGRALGLSSTAVWKWFQSTKRLPAEHVLNAERIYGVSRHDLRPDIYPVDYPAAERFYGVDQQARSA